MIVFKVAFAVAFTVTTVLALFFIIKHEMHKRQEKKKKIKIPLRKM